MVLSVIIVSYNVKYFLEQCLCSVQRAMDENVEVFVVDNNSTDGTVTYLRERFPFVQFIVNDENVGFAKANNLALQKARGKYVLFLNPDTIIPGDLFTQCCSFMDAHDDAGALGVRMIDGSGEFLPESKRGFPSPWVAFCKMSGLTNLFPRSKTFAKYYLGHLPEKEINTVDALAGACMLVRKELLDKIGGFDEQFFMYAEDIDLSYRVQQAGYKNYYFPQTTIIHFKGESTRKDARYVRLFYNAMIQFAEKHFRKKSTIGTALLNAAIKMRAGVALLTSNKPQAARTQHYIFPHNLGDEKTLAAMPPLSSTHPTAKNSRIIAEGPAFSFKQVIEQLEKTSVQDPIFIHGGGTHSMVSSGSKNEPGIALSWA
jgi:N-acetylglucosaminyl-diphospho-decaprenol L-rhamnosyltransferase